MNEIDIEKIYDVVIHGNINCRNIFEICSDYATVEEFIEKNRKGKKKIMPIMNEKEFFVYQYLKVVVGIAHLRGYDIYSKQIKTKTILCLAGDEAIGILKKAGCPNAEKFNAKDSFPMYSYYLTKQIATMTSAILRERIPEIIESFLLTLDPFTFLSRLGSSIIKSISETQRRIQFDVPADIINYSKKMFV